MTRQSCFPHSARKIVSHTVFCRVLAQIIPVQIDRKLRFPDSVKPHGGRPLFLHTGSFRCKYNGLVFYIIVYGNRKVKAVIGLRSLS